MTRHSASFSFQDRQLRCQCEGERHSQDRKADGVSFSDPAGLVFTVLLVAAVTVVYVPAGRRTVGATAGEVFLNVRYLPRPEGPTKDSAE